MPGTDTVNVTSRKGSVMPLIASGSTARNPTVTPQTKAAKIIFRRIDPSM
jgi:hypothetical protein